MTTETRWTLLSVDRGTPLVAWLRRRSVDDKRCTAALHEWENEGGTLLPVSKAGTTSS
jgi:hypothetical protein